MKLQKVLSTLVLFGLGLASQVAAEGPPGKAFLKSSRDLKLNVDLVSLNVVVTDQKGYAVQGLSKEDFKVYENRVEQPISFFSQEEAPVSWGLALDRSRSMGPLIHEVHQAALHVIEEGWGKTRCLSSLLMMRSRWFRISLQIAIGWPTLFSASTPTAERRCSTR